MLKNIYGIQQAPPALRVLTWGMVLWASGLLAMACHEAGHVLAALATGGTVEALVLSPVAFSRTDLSHNPEPLIVVWAGPIIGVLLPALLCLMISGLARTRLAVPVLLRWWAVFFAGLCGLMNGAYLTLGWIDRVGDAGDMMRLGTPIPVMIVVGLAMFAFGLWFGHRLGPRLGLAGMRNGQAWGVLVPAVLVIGIGFALQAFGVTQ